MAKGSRGGRYSTVSLGGGGGAPQPVQQPQQQPVQVSSDLKQQAAFASLSDDEKADAISQALRDGVPAHINQSSQYQAVLYNLGTNDKPEIVSDAQLRSMPGPTLYRTVNSVYDSSSDIAYSAPEIAAQTQIGKTTRVSSGGTAVYGDGIYFATSRSESTAYGNTRGNLNKTCVMTAKFNSSAKSIRYAAASAGATNEIRSGSKLGRVLGRMSRQSAISTWAFCQGYSVIDVGSYQNVINRGALTMTRTITPA